MSHAVAHYCALYRHSGCWEFSTLTRPPGNTERSSKCMRGNEEDAYDLLTSRVECLTLVCTVLRRWKDTCFQVPRYVMRRECNS